MRHTQKKMNTCIEVKEREWKKKSPQNYKLTLYSYRRWPRLNYISDLWIKQFFCSVYFFHSKIHQFARKLFFPKQFRIWHTLIITNLYEFPFTWNLMFTNLKMFYILFGIFYQISSTKYFILTRIFSL